MSNPQSTNPWPGLGSYDESGRYEFCGRRKAANELYSLISNNAVVSLFGRSGIGKTSLIKAGVTPLLIRKGFLPIYVRLSQEKKIPDEKRILSYAECVVRSLEKMMQEKGFDKSKTESETEVDVVNSESPDYLWSYFCRTVFKNGEENVTPVIILDQFEEIFQDQSGEAAMLMRQLYALVNDSKRWPKSIADYVEFRNRFRFVMSFRDDSLYRLEDVINEYNLASFKENRYLLKALDIESAKEVITKPGEGFVDNEAADRIVKKVVPESGGSSVDPAVLSLLMYGLYERMTQEGQSSLQSNLIDEDRNDIVKKFYEQGMSGIGLSARKYLEENLVTRDGRRRSVAAADASSSGVKEGDLKLLEEKHILTKLERGNDTDYELTHDVLCPIVVASYEETKAKEKIAKSKRKVRFMAVILTIVLALVVVFIIQNKHIREQQWLAQGNESKYIAEKALELAEEGDVYLAKLLLLNTIPKDLEHPERPLTPESVSALAKIFDEESGILVRCWGKKVVFSPEGKTIASSNDIIKIWDVASGNCLRTLTLLDRKIKINSPMYSPDGKTIVANCSDSTARIWNVRTGACIHTLKGHKNQVFSAVFSPDGKKVVTTSGDSTARIWNATTEKCLHTLKHEGWKVYSAVFSPDGKKVVTTSGDSTARIWSVTTGDCLDTLKHEHGYVSSAVFSPDGKKVVTTSGDSTTRIWSVITGDCLDTLKNEHEVDRSVVFSPNGKTIVTIEKSTARIWSVITGDCLHTLKGHTNYVLSVMYSPDGKTIVSASGDRTIRIWDASTGNCLDTLKGHKDWVYSAVFSPDGKTIVSASGDQTIRIWSVSAEEDAWKPLTNSTNWASSSSKSYQGNIVVTTDDHSAKIWNASTGKCLSSLPIPIKTASYSPDGKTIVTTSNDTVTIWDALRRKPLKTKKESSYVISASYSPDGKTILVQLWSDVRICDNSLKNSYVLGGKFGYKAYSSSYSPDGKKVVTTSFLDSTVCIWNPYNGKCLKKIKTKSITSSPRYSPDGKTILTSHWILYAPTYEKNQRSIHVLPHAQFSPDGKSILSYTTDAIEIFDVFTGEILKTIPCENMESKIVSASYSPDGKSIVVILSNGIVMMRKAPPSLQEMLEITRKKFRNRELTTEEKERFYLE